MVQVNIQNVYGIQIKYVGETDLKAPKYVLTMNTIKRTFAVPQEASNSQEEMAILLKQFYSHGHMELPKNGFNVVRINNELKLAIPNQN